MPETSKRIFFGSLSYILLSIEKDIYARLLYLTRLSIGCGIGWNAESLYKSGLEVDDFDMIIKEMEGYKDTFLTEAFIISNIKIGKKLTEISSLKGKPTITKATLTTLR